MRTYYKTIEKWLYNKPQNEQVRIMLTISAGYELAWLWMGLLFTHRTPEFIILMHKALAFFILGSLVGVLMMALLAYKIANYHGKA